MVFCIKRTVMTWLSCRISLSLLVPNQFYDLKKKGSLVLLFSLEKFSIKHKKLGKSTKVLIYHILLLCTANFAVMYSKFCCYVQQIFCNVQQNIVKKKGFESLFFPVDNRYFQSCDRKNAFYIRKNDDLKKPFLFMKFCCNVQ